MGAGDDGNKETGADDTVNRAMEKEDAEASEDIEKKFEPTLAVVPERPQRDTAMTAPATSKSGVAATQPGRRKSTAATRKGRGTRPTSGIKSTSTNKTRGSKGKVDKEK